MLLRILIVVGLVGSAALAVGQEITIYNSSKSERYSEDEIALEDLYIAANQKKILLKFDEAIEIYKQILSKNEVNPAVHHDLARIYVEQEEYEKAVSAGKKAIRYDQQNRWYKLTLAEIYEISHEYTEAAELLGQIASTNPNQDLYQRWAQNLEFANLKLEAIKVHDTADQLFGINEGRSDSKVDLYLSLGQEKNALNEVKKWTETNPNNVDYQLKLARYFDFRGDSKKARKTYQHVLTLNPNEEEAVFYLSKNKKKNPNSDLSVLVNNPNIGIDNKVLTLIPLLEKGNEEILTLCESITRQYPEDAKSHALYADALWLNDQADAALVQYEKSLAISKSVYQVWDQILVVLAYNRNYDQLEDIAAEAMDYYPNQAGPYYYSALSSFEKGQYDEALDMVDEAIFISEIGVSYIYPDAIQLKAQVLHSSSKSKDAIQTIEQMDQDRKTASVMELLGDLYLQENDKVSAERAWRESIRLGGAADRIQLKIDSI